MLASYLSAIPLPCVFIGQDKRVLGANNLALTLKPGLVEQRSYILMFRQPAFGAAVEQCLSTKETQRATYLHTEGQQETRYELTCSYITLPEATQPEVKGILVCFQDITQVQQAGEIRRDFVANVSHELKTPLTALLGFIETLQGPAKNDAEARARFLGIMASEAKRMNRLVGDLLSLSRVEEDARMRPTDAVDIRDLLRSVIRNLSEVAKDRLHQIKFAAPDAPVKILGDQDQLTQVFTNLIENAQKYGGETAQVTVTLEEFDWDATLRRAAVRVRVQDSGPGIEAIHIPRLTERFYRIDSHRSREVGGTGLGLAIVKHIVNRHRGRLKIASVLGQGSTFTALLPKN
ncbi:ATP-binding protein [Cognatishimia sp. WU-CL00825]|uniref:sensor histidine kinase n=1 Tax=Cognatishimia sp. WU-CL00825 TaxID=3127658 RepID=UPI003107D78A